MPVLNFELRKVTTSTKLANLLNVNMRVLDVMSLSDTTCRNMGCYLPLSVNNSNRCVICSQIWYPRNKRRGYDLYGSQFMLRYCGKQARKACCCTSDLCQKNGYSRMGMICLPTNHDKCIEAIVALSIDPKYRQQIADNPEKHRVAP